MKFETSVTWEAPLARVLAMLTSPDYVVRKAELANHDGFTVIAHEDDGRHFAITARVLSKPSIKLPAIAQKFVKSDQAIEIDQVDRWDREAATGSLQIVNQSVKAVSISATMRLQECDGVTTNTISWNVSCDVPFVGGKLASLIAEDIQQKAAVNADVSRQILLKNY
ncbi:MAG: DUF2505 domain-containing protein [Pseudomonadota bacterium]